MATYNREVRIDINDIFHSYCYSVNGKCFINASISAQGESQIIPNNQMDIMQIKDYNINNQINTNGEGGLNE